MMRAKFSMECIDLLDFSFRLFWMITSNTRVQWCVHCAGICFLGLSVESRDLLSHLEFIFLVLFVVHLNYILFSYFLLVLEVIA